MRRLLLFACTWALTLPSCAYYNGMYNAKRSASAAERSERMGRQSEAMERWRVAAIHAESVVARHPESRWADDAMLLRARAMVHLENWSEAVVASEAALRMVQTEEQRREAQLQLGLAQLGLRRAAPALDALDSAVLSHEAERRSLARLGRGRALMWLGRPSEALEDFRVSGHAEAGYERARAALNAHQHELAVAFLDTLAGGRSFHDARWLTLLDSLGRAGRRADASRLTDVLVLRPDVGRGAQARMLLADAARRADAGDDAGAALRYREVARLVPDSIEGRLARVRLVRITYRTAVTPDEVAGARRELPLHAAMGGVAGQEALDLMRLLALVDTLTSSPGPADAFWFLRAELLRDSLGASRLAAAAFAQMPARFPESPWTPKGILAALALGHPSADSLRTLLRTRYASSPYALVAGGGDDPVRFAALEDSLRVSLALAPGLASRTAAPDARVIGPPGVVQQPQVPRTQPTADP